MGAIKIQCLASEEVEIPAIQHSKSNPT